MWTDEELSVLALNVRSLAASGFFDEHDDTTPLVADEATDEFYEPPFPASTLEAARTLLALTDPAYDFSDGSDAGIATHLWSAYRDKVASMWRTGDPDTVRLLAAIEHIVLLWQPSADWPLMEQAALAKGLMRVLGIRVTRPSLNVGRGVTPSVGRRVGPDIGSWMGSNMRAQNASWQTGQIVLPTSW